VATPTLFFTAKRQRTPCLTIFTRYIPPITHTRVDDRCDVAYPRHLLKTTFGILFHHLKMRFCIYLAIICKLTYVMHILSWIYCKDFLTSFTVVGYHYMLFYTKFPHPGSASLSSFSKSMSTLDIPNRYSFSLINHFMSWYHGFFFFYVNQPTNTNKDPLHVPNGPIIMSKMKALK
jgi:hypothetical protein